MQRRCDLAAGSCAAVADWLLLDDRERDAVRMYERFMAQARDEVAIAHNINWLVRYYRDQGRLDDAVALAQHGAATQSRGGLEALADLLDAERHYEQAEQVYRMIAEHYNITAPLGTFLMRRALDAHDKALEIEASDLLRHDFPNGLERLVLYALHGSPTDGIAFKTFGRRPASVGLEATDVIVAVDGWRVRTAGQYMDASRLATGDMMTFVVWRNGQYREIRHRVPQRWLGTTFQDYVARQTARR
jgi:tetratricopeptide (TPR) repeat protein